jgi:uncharacterized protein YaaN involved in tellurite resistance
MSKYLAKKNMDTLSLDDIDEARKAQIISIKDGIVLSRDTTLEYAESASKNLTAFSSDLLKTVKLKDTPEVEGLINELLGSLEKVDASTLSTKKPTFLQRLFRVDEVKQFITRYEDVETVVDGVKEKLELANFQLKKDIEVCHRYLEQNEAYINDLDNFIMAGRLKVQEEQAAIDAERASVDLDDQLAVYALNARQGELDRFERKLHNLMLMRAIAIQNIPQIILIADGDSVLIEKIESSINSAIPLWESQMVIAIQLMRQKGALALEKAVTQTTNNLIAQNGEMLKTGSLEVAKALETGIVDIEVLKKNSENLIATLKGIKTIREEGKQARMKATQELGLLQSKLNEQLLLNGD